MLKVRTKRKEVCYLPRLQGSFDASLQFSRAKKPCGCLGTSEDNKMRQKDGDKGLRGEISSLFDGTRRRVVQKCPHLSLLGERVSSRA